MKNRGIFLLAAAVVLLGSPVLAAENTCKTPTSPTVPDGKTTDAPALIAAANEVKAFIAASDEYQLCLNAWLKAETDAAKAAKADVNPIFKAEHDRLGEANQKEKERVGGLYNTAAAAYRTAHPK